MLIYAPPRPCGPQHQASGEPTGACHVGSYRPSATGRPRWVEDKVSSQPWHSRPNHCSRINGLFSLKWGRGRLIPTSCPTKSDHLGEPGSFEESKTWHPSKRHFLSSSDPKCQPWEFLVVSTPSDLWRLSPGCLGKWRPMSPTAHCPSYSSESTKLAPGPPSFHFPWAGHGCVPVGWIKPGGRLTTCIFLFLSPL